MLQGGSNIGCYRGVVTSAFLGIWCIYGNFCWENQMLQGGVVTSDVTGRGSNICRPRDFRVSGVYMKFMLQERFFKRNA